jgi:hypothetical protein
MVHACRHVDDPTARQGSKPTSQPFLLPTRASWQICRASTWDSHPCLLPYARRVLFFFLRVYAIRAQERVVGPVPHGWFCYMHARFKDRSLELSSMIRWVYTNYRQHYIINRCTWYGDLDCTLQLASLRPVTPPMAISHFSRCQFSQKKSFHFLRFILLLTLFDFRAHTVTYSPLYIKILLLSISLFLN